MSNKEKAYKRLINQLPETITLYDSLDKQHDALNKQATAVRKKYGRGAEGKKLLIPILISLQALYEEVDKIYRPTRREIIGRTFISGILRYLEEQYGED